MPSTQATEPKTTAASRPPKKKSVASSSKKLASSKSAARLPLAMESGGEEESLTRSKRPQTESRPTPKVVSSLALTSLSEGVPSPQTEAASRAKDFEAPPTLSISGSENSQAP